MSETTWMPDGRGLTDLTLDLVAEHGARVHLRLTSLDGAAQGACTGGLGELWTGRAEQVNCPDCLEVVHA